MESLTMPQRPHHACDFDGTLARYDGLKNPLVLGDPIPEMLDRVRRWLARGDRVTIFTARVSSDDPLDRMQRVLALQAWCRKHLGQVLEVTDRKQGCFTDYWDDRNVCIQRNSGKVLCDPFSPAGTSWR